jgi:hypothetical protein
VITQAKGVGTAGIVLPVARLCASSTWLMVQHSPTTARTLCLYFSGFCSHYQLLILEWPCRGIIYRKYASCNIANIFGSLHTKSTEALESSNRRVLTMNVTSVPGFRPLFSTATPIEPIRPSKLSRKNPGCRILFSWLVSLPFQIMPHTEH